MSTESLDTPSRFFIQLIDPCRTSESLLSDKKNAYCGLEPGTHAPLVCFGVVYFTVLWGACVATPHAPPAGNMLWRNIGTALGQRRSTQEKLKSTTLRVVVARDGASWGKRRVLVPRYLRQVIFVSGHQVSRGSRPPRACAWRRLSPPFRVPAPPLDFGFL